MLAIRPIDDVGIFFPEDFQERANKVQTPGDKDLDTTFVTHGGNKSGGLPDGWNYVHIRATTYFMGPCLCKLVLNPEGC